MDQIIMQFLGDIPYTAKAFGSGHINSTYKVTTQEKAYVLQRINHYVFPHPEQVMENSIAVTEHLRKKGCNALTFLYAKDGKPYYLDSAGNYWRMCEFMKGVALDAPEQKEDLYQAGRAFGQFQALLSDFPSAQLHEVIPRFHDTPHRYQQLRAVVEKDPLGRAGQVSDMLNWLWEQEQLAGTLQQMLEEGKLPLRVTHNDTKLNNVLLDEATRKPVCVLDLDTVMPGLSAFDFGDAIRFGAATNREDDGHNELDLELFQQYAKGYLQVATTLTCEERSVLCLGAFIMTLEVGLRFLTDYIDGDHYFKTTVPEQNRIRAKNQLLLAEDILKKLPQMEEIIKKEGI